jgi:short subunit dehydrogenase-like uncharacterized protein
MDRDFDIVLLGATGFTGRVVAEHLLARYGAGSGLRWALAGRNPDKLAALRAELGAADLPIVVADTDDAASMTAMAARAKVIATTAGPYQAHGEPVVAACAAAGADYVDITGETLWVRAMFAYEAQAKATGARITPFCGFDSIPFELGVWVLQRAAVDRFGAPCARVRGRVRRLYRGVRGGMSGGSVATLMATIAQVQADPELGAVLADPFALTPGFRGPAQPDGSQAYEDPAVGAWVAPFMMAAVNTKVVHRANLLLGHPWGADFRYDEMQVVDGPPSGAPSLADIVADPSRPPQPGEGPSRADREGGCYELLFLGEAGAGRTLSVRVESDLDASVGSTAALLAESAVCLARDVGRDATPGGVWTPAAAMGEALLARLEANASIRFHVEA